MSRRATEHEIQPLEASNLMKKGNNFEAAKILHDHWTNQAKNKQEIEHMIKRMHSTKY